MERSIRAKRMDLLNGPLWYKIVLFAIPLAASSILQQFFNAADMAIVGRFEGSVALAAVGSNASVVNLLVNTFTGLSVGANVIISRCLGEGSRHRIQAAVHTAILVALVGGTGLSAIGIALARPLLSLMETPPAVLEPAVLYLRIYFLGMPFLMLYNFGAAVFRSRGDTKRPFFCLFASGILNVLLNLLFVLAFRMGVAGVAVATVLSNAVSGMLELYFLAHEESEVRFSFSNLQMDFSVLKEIVRIGLPAGLQGMVFSISNMYLQTALNSLGADVMAASAAVTNLEWLVYFLVNAFTQACLTFVSQNFGAKNYRRCSRVTHLCLLMALGMSLALSILLWSFGSGLMQLYTTDAPVIGYGLIRIKYCLLPQCITAIMDVFGGSIRGMGSSLTPTIITLLGSCGLRILWVYKVFPHFKTFEALLLVYLVTWIATGVPMFIAYLIVNRRIKHPIKIHEC